MCLRTAARRQSSFAGRRWVFDLSLRILRTANAGVLLTLDGCRVLLDGVCCPAAPYLATPQPMKRQLLQCPPDALAFTHDHGDHFDPDFASEYQKQTLRPILGPESLPVSPIVSGNLKAGALTLTAIPSRHIGKGGGETAHVSILVEGSMRVFCTGDASPLYWDSPKGVPMPKADVLLATYAYCTSAGGWRAAMRSGAKTVVLLHMPEQAQDPYGLWEAVKLTMGGVSGIDLRIPDLGQSVNITK